MSLKNVAEELVAGVREGRAKENLQKLYAADAVSVEAADMGNGRECTGIEAIRGKHDWWESAYEMLDGSVSDPYPHGEDRFGVHYAMKTKNKETGAVEEFDELAVYHVKGDKIVREEFFYRTE